MKQSPIGIQDFRKIVEGGFLYVDKTEIIYKLINNSACFLSRPRRFGKSLLISTLEEIFLGHEELFKGLWIEHSGYKWPVHPVIRIDFSKIPSSDISIFEEELNQKLFEIGQANEITLDRHPSPAGKAGSLIKDLYRKTKQKVVILIDEYDSPIISNNNIS